MGFLIRWEEVNCLWLNGSLYYRCKINVSAAVMLQPVEETLNKCLMSHISLSVETTMTHGNTHALHMTKTPKTQGMEYVTIHGNTFWSIIV